jgi:uncharacterized cupredoxin-like copper-binding protein
MVANGLDAAQGTSKLSFLNLHSQKLRTGKRMTSSFQQHHGAMLLKYSGISFISGAVNHGFFSGTRSLWTAAIGITVAAGQVGELVVTFPKAMTLQMACLIPGHYEAGMRGTITVGAKAKTPTSPEAAQNDHQTHPH